MSTNHVKEVVGITMYCTQVLCALLVKLKKCYCTKHCIYN